MPNRKRHALRLIAPAMISALLLAGCGGSDISRVPVSGTVTLNGQPLQSASILFVPLGEGPTVGASFEGESFKIGQDAGPGPGEYQVEIRAYRGTGQMVPDGDRPGQMTEVQQQIVPARYSDATELRVTVSADGPNHFPFDLTSP